MFRPSKFVGGLGMLGIVVGLTAGAYGFTNSNTVPDSKAGDGTGNISGYIVSGIHYDLDATTPTNVSDVKFTVDSAPISGSTIKAKIGGNWYTCTNATAAITCPTVSPTQLTVGPAVTLEALIAD